MQRGELLTIPDAAAALHVSHRQVRRLAAAGVLGKPARGLIDRDSVDRYRDANLGGRTRSWAEHTAWAAAALLAGQTASWLRASQTSRLRRSLRDVHDVEDLLARMRGRTVVQIYDAHRAAVTRLRDKVVASDWGVIGIAPLSESSVDGYLAWDEVDRLVESLGLRISTHGNVTLRVTRFDLQHARGLVATRTVAALDAATKSHARANGVGRAVLQKLLAVSR